MYRLWLRVLILIVAIATISVSLLHIWELRWVAGAVSAQHGPARHGLIMLLLAYTLYALLASVAAIAVARLAWQTAAAQALALYLALAGFSMNALALSSVLSHEIFGNSPVAYRMSGVAAAFGLAAIVRFSALFPAPLSDRRPYILWGAATLLAVLFATGVLQLSVLLSVGAVMVSGTLVAFNLRTGYRRSDEAGRRKIEWIFMSVMAGLTLILFDAALLLATRFIPGFDPPVLGWDAWLLFLGLGLGLVFILLAVFYRGALDPALLIRRTVVIATLTPVLVFVFAGVENIVANVLAQRLGFDARVGGWIAGGTVALAFGPLRDGINKVVQRGRSEVQ